MYGHDILSNRTSFLSRHSPDTLTGGALTRDGSPGRCVLPGIDGAEVRFNVNQITPTTERIVANMGMPKKGGGRGDVHVKFAIIFPNPLSDAQKASLRASLGPGTAAAGAGGPVLSTAKPL